MDPNEALATMRNAAERLNAANETDLEAQAIAGGELAEAFAGLDTWLNGGGFLPADWAR